MAITRLGGANAISGAITSSNLPTGSILQVQSTLKTTSFTQSASANTDTAIANMSVNITPSATSSKIMLMARIVGELSSTNNYDIMYFILRGSTKINSGFPSGVKNQGIIPVSQGYWGSDATSTMDSANIITIDSSHNSTSELTYHIGLNVVSAGTLYVNRTVSTSNSAGYELGSSEIIAMEIKG